MYCNAKWMNPNPGVPREEKVCTQTQVKLCGLAFSYFKFVSKDDNNQQLGRRDIDSVQGYQTWGQRKTTREKAALAQVNNKMKVMLDD